MKLHYYTELTLRGIFDEGLRRQEDAFLSWLNSKEFKNLHPDSCEETLEVVKGIISNKYKVSIIVEEIK